MPKFKEDDLTLLVPALQPVIAQLLSNLQAKGFKTVLFDTLRTPEQAAKNAAKGTGSKGSMHMYGCAADILCGEHGWDCAKPHFSPACGFYGALVAEAEALKLVAGARWSHPDTDHVQGVSIAQQEAVRACGILTDKNRDAINAFVVKFLAR